MTPKVLKTSKFSPEYLAGVLDSDGSFSITIRHKTRKNPNFTCMIQITWSLTDKAQEFMEHLVQTYGGSYHINTTKYATNYPNSKTVIKYCAVAHAVDRILLDVAPYVWLKKHQVTNLLAVRKLASHYPRPRPEGLTNHYLALYEANKILNSKNSGQRYDS